MGIATIVNSAGERFTTGGTYWNGVSSTTKGLPVIEQRLYDLEQSTSGTGGMLKSTYDTNNNDIADNSEKLGNKSSDTYVMKSSTHDTQINTNRTDIAELKVSSGTNQANIRLINPTTAYLFEQVYSSWSNLNTNKATLTQVNSTYTAVFNLINSTWTDLNTNKASLTQVNSTYTAVVGFINSTGSALTTEIANRLTHESEVGESTQTIRDDMNTNFTAVGESTSGIKTEMDAGFVSVGESTAGIKTDMDTGFVAVGESTATQRTDFDNYKTLVAVDTTTEKTDRITADNLIMANTPQFAIAVDVGISTQTEANTRATADNEIGLSTLTLKTDINTVATNSGISTMTISTQMVYSTGSTMTGNLTVPEVKVSIINTNGSEGIFISSHIMPVYNDQNIGDYNAELVVDSSTIALWHFNENTTRPVDSSGNEFHLYNKSATVPVYITSGIIGGAWDFSGVDSYMMLYDSETAGKFNSFSGLTIEAWIYPHTVAAGNAFVFAKSNYPSTVQLWLGRSTDEVIFYVGNGGAYNSAYSLTSSRDCVVVNTWNHIAGTWNGAVMTVYCNGIPVASKANTIVQSTGTSQDIYIGCDKQGAKYVDEFNGNIDEVKFSTRCYSADEIIKHFQLRNRRFNAISVDYINALQYGRLFNFPDGANFVVDSDNDDIGNLTFFDGGGNLIFRLGAKAPYFTMYQEFEMNNYRLDMGGGDIISIDPGIYFGTANDTAVIRNGANRLGMAAGDSFKCGSVSSLPTTGYGEGDMLWNTTDKTLYIATQTVVNTGSWKSVW